MEIPFIFMKGKSQVEIEDHEQDHDQKMGQDDPDQTQEIVQDLKANIRNLVQDLDHHLPQGNVQDQEADRIEDHEVGPIASGNQEADPIAEKNLARC